VTLSSPVNATLADGTAQGTITDDDPLPELSIGDCAVVEGNTGTRPCTLTVALNPASGRTVTVAHQTNPAGATPGVDYTSPSGTLTFPPGTTTQAVTVTVLGDTSVEPDEGVLVVLGVPTNATIATNSAQGTIVDDDAPSLSSIELTHGASVAADL